MLTLQSLANIEGKDRTGGPIWKYATGTLISVLSNSTAEKCVPMQIKKQPEHGRTLTTEEQK